MDFMMSLDVRKIPYIGRMTELVLNNLGISSGKDALDKAAEVYLSFKPKTVQFLIKSFLGLGKLCHGEDDGFELVQRAVGLSQTFGCIKTYEGFKEKIG